MVISAKIARSIAPGQTCVVILWQILPGVAHSKYSSHSFVIRVRSGRDRKASGVRGSFSGEESGLVYASRTSRLGNVSSTWLAAAGRRPPVMPSGSEDRTSRKRLRHVASDASLSGEEAAAWSSAPSPYLTTPKEVDLPQFSMPCKRLVGTIEHKYTYETHLVIVPTSKKGKQDEAFAGHHAVYLRLDALRLIKGNKPFILPFIPSRRGVVSE